MTTAITLSDYAIQPNKLVAGVARVLRENSKFMDILPFENVGSLSVKVMREASALPSVSWRNIGSSHGSVKAQKPDLVEEQAFSIGNEIIVDKVLMRDTSPKLYEVMPYQTQMITKAIARNFTNAAINGVPTDITNPVGLWWRTLNDLGSSQRINAGIDISPDASGLAANIQTFIDALDSLLYAVVDSVDAGGKGVYLLMNDTCMLRMQSAFRQSGALKQTTDALGRIFLEYKGAKLIDMGYKYDEATRIITNTENGTALTGGGATSIYAVRVGKEYFTGWQEYAMEVSKPELQSDKVTYKSVIDWTVGLALSNPRSVARLYGITAA